MKNLEKLMYILENRENESLTGKLELEQNSELLENIFDKKTILYIDGPSVKIDDEGEVVNFGIEKCEKTLFVQSRFIKINDDDFIKKHITSSNIYLYKIEKKTEDTILIRLAELNLNKIKKTFTISENVFNEFAQISDRLAINKSKFVENKIKEFIEKNR